MTPGSLAPVDKTGLILSIDTAGPACQAVVSDGARVVSSRSMTMLRGHGEALIPMVEDGLGEAVITYEDLDRVAVTVGPGSFTGMRVGLAAARGFSATLNIPIVGIGTLEAMAVTDRLASDVAAVRCVAIDARNGLVYGQRFEIDGTAMEQPSVMADLVFAASVPQGGRLVGPATPIIAALARSAGKQVTLGDSAQVPSIEALAELAAASDAGEKPRPLYLKPADAIAAKPAGLRVGSSIGSV
ncbi:MAG: tRNA (adenosine(37)-N6)-threonylcarbamoyltransferase complex dimerization subunit type 1 TsaB [Rhizobiales bacterium]|nr:tRNA (adenosine(37)-N6)-threonylcarbamoyltransferase complex dimerization subunit type 1 TsaB [Hyphomicrobiales bacterium]MBO6699456.1 tRNA (adenosine(37)-N6)-threonylcarbamoyltransferase complex dimerization subunit type 1 TsaB [Hyphomicrobiales bacterium]MBO6736994.1 tRNA (adenosine(37)-N6)-threonylcarbamoyltransferase complex dimerization subunit type 1 TsaB [Hyphomicrobiales bacterium]MBO6911932.1 tRNA (adenosine(37)-N6)-threonylcarbamoyltransferase complex dimerization subunit type 1 Tsa